MVFTTLRVFLLIIIIGRAGKLLAVRGGHHCWIICVINLVPFEIVLDGRQRLVCVEGGEVEGLPLRVVAARLALINFSKDSRAGLAEALKRHQKMSKAQDYSFVRI